MKNINETDPEIVNVLFLIEKPQNDLPQEIFAYFPNEHYYHKEHKDYNKMFMCYSHIGQHSSVHIDYANECKEATKEQYNSLVNELTHLGYNLNILNKQPENMSNSKHTQGTWRDVAQMPNGYTIENEKGQVIAFIQDDENENSDPNTVISSAESYENAKLIASAPELLSLLGYIVNEIETTPNELNEALLGLIKLKANKLIDKINK